MLMMREHLTYEAAGAPLKILAASGIFAIAIESFIDMDFMWADYTPVILFLLLIVYEKGKI